MYDYEATLVKHHGIFGKRKDKTPLGQVAVDQSLEHRLGDSAVSLSIGQLNTLIIKAEGQPIKVNFLAEPHRLRSSSVSVTLDREQPEIATNRRKVIICQENDPTSELELTAPEFRPLALNPSTKEINELAHSDVAEYMDFITKTGGQMRFIQ